MDAVLEPGLYRLFTLRNDCVPAVLRRRSRMFRPSSADATIVASVAIRPEDVTESPHRSNESGLARIRLDLLANPVDPHVDGPVERVRIPSIGEIEKAVARENPLGVIGEGAKQGVLGFGEHLLAAGIVAQAVGVEVEPTRAHADGLRGRFGRAGRGRSGGGASAQD